MADTVIEPAPAQPGTGDHAVASPDMMRSPSPDASVPEVPSPERSPSPAAVTPTMTSEPPIHNAPTSFTPYDSKPSDGYDYYNSLNEDDKYFKSSSAQPRSYGGHDLDDVDITVDRDYSSRLLGKAGGFSSSVRQNIHGHPLLIRARPEVRPPPGLSSRSRHVMRQGFDIGFNTPALRALYDVLNYCLLTFLSLLS